MTSSLIDQRSLRVRFNEADPLGVVWHGHYVRYFEDGRESFGAKFGLRYLDFFDHGYVVPVVHIECNYRRPLRYGDTAIVETEFVPSEAAKIKFKYRLYKSDTKELIADGSSIQVFLTKDDFVLHLINPPFFDEWKKQQGLPG